MADTKISDAAAVTSTLGTEMLPVALPSDSTAYKIAIEDMRVGADAAAASGDAGSSIQFTAGAGDGAGYGGTIQLTAGLGGSGETYSHGGPVYIAAGTGGTVDPGGYAYGGDIEITGGDPGSGDNNYSGQIFVQTSSGEYGSANGWSGDITLLTGTGQGTGYSGDIKLQTGLGGGSGGCGWIYLNPATGPGNPGRISVNNNASLHSVSRSWAAGEAVNGVTIYTAARAEVVTAIIGRIKAANGSAATLTLVKCASGVAPGAGTALTTNSVDLAGSVDTNQTLTLSSTLADITLAAGDSIVIVTTGSLVLAQGTITCWLTWQ